jgi:hypothetical protein
MQTHFHALIPVPLIENELPIDAVSMPDKQQGATMRSLCALLDIDKGRQVARIKRNPGLSAALVLMLVETPGGPQSTEVLQSWAIPIWAAGLHTSRLPERKRALALILQQKAFTAIEQAFAQPKNDAPASPPPPPEPAQSSLRQIKEGLLLAVEGLSSFEAEYQAVVDRVTTLEGGPARPLVGFSPQRLAQINLLAYRARQKHGYPIAMTLAGLAERFQVADVFDLPDKDWPAVLDWFSALLEE